MKLILTIVICALFLMSFQLSNPSKVMKIKKQLIFELQEADKFKRFVAHKQIFFNKGNAYLMLYNSHFKHIAVYGENNAQPESIFYLSELDKMAETPFGKPISCVFTGVDSTVIFSEKYCAFIVKNEVKWLKYSESVLGKGNYFITSNFSNHTPDLINRKLLLFYGGEFSRKDKQYEADFSMLALLDLNSGDVEKLIFKNPDLKDYQSKLQEVSAVTKNKRIYLHYGFDSDIYVIEDGKNIAKYTLQNKTDRLIQSSSIIPDEVSNSEKRKYFGDFYPFAEGFYNITRKHSKLGSGTITELHFYDETFNNTQTILLEKQDYHFPATGFFESGFVLQIKSKDQQENMLFFDYYSIH